MLLAAAGGRYLPCVYKLGVAGLCLLATVRVLRGGARGGTGTASAACSACGLVGCSCGGAKPCRDLLEAGDVDLLMTTLAVLAQAGLLLRYHYTAVPSRRGWGSG